MKLPLLSIALGTVFLSSTAQAQSTDCDFLKSEVARLKAENTYLRNNAGKKLTASTSAQPVATTATSTATANVQKEIVEKVEVTIARCIGNRKTQTVSVELLLKNTGPTRDLQFQQITGVDAAGEEYRTFDIQIGSGGIRNKVPTDVAIKTRAVIPKILPATKSFQVLTCMVFSDVNIGRTINLEFRNVPIVWQ
ncbi:hypothetical protein MTX78_03300 [Hymenobacter tibetensis]|uniref:Uncharacterized protein n=1 Tax=Hymenobacter tibetensis TaxID=497967 RepID=A0ABY4D158_9BACT|nr:hypothetical protein [Hymenobacter tibetensis]UOG75624.1 hypothetical protein MTX78_03300 [Hymenobacter tibetensis]